MTNFQSAIANDIRAYLYAHKLTPSGLARITGTSKSAINRVLRGAGQFAEESFWRLAEVVDFSDESMNEMFGESDRQPWPVTVARLKESPTFAMVAW